MRAMLRRLRNRFLARFEPKVRARLQLQVENLESRTLLSASSLDGLFATPANIFSNRVTNPTPVGYTPEQIRHAYGFDQIAFNNGAIVGDGSGQTIAIVDAYSAPTIARDLHTFDQTFHLPDPVLSTVREYVYGRAPQTDAGWALETSLDVEWAHTAAPGANILLVEAASSSYSDLMSAVDYARNYPGVSVVSMSWGGGEFAGETAYDSHFTTPTGHSGVTFIASSGDNGGSVAYPAASPNVVSVGGTNLHVNADGTTASETAWDGSGGGVSAYESKPSYQQGVAGTGDGRSSPDVALNASTSTGYAVFDSAGYGWQNGWFQLGGTSAGAPQWAGLVAVANQGRALAGSSSLDGATQTLPALYSMPATNFNDITSGASANGQNVAVPGYDTVTGRGTPVASLVVQSLSGVTVSTPVPVQTTAVTSSSTTAVHSTQTTLNRTSGTKAAFVVTDPTLVLVSSIPLPGFSNGPTVPLPTVTTTADRGNGVVNQAFLEGPSAAANLLASIRNAAGYKNASGKEVLLAPGENRDELQENGAAPQRKTDGAAGAAREAFPTPAGLQSGALAPEDSDAYFMSEEILDGGMATSWLSDDQAAFFTQALTRLGAVVVVAGGYWSANLAESDNRNRRPGLPTR